MIYLYAIGSGFAGMMLATAINWWSIRGWRKTAEEHWTERARVLFPARKGAFWNFILLPLIAVILAERIFGQPMADRFPARLSVLVFTWFGVMGGSFSMSREISPWLPLRSWVRETISSWLFLVLWVGTYPLMIGMMPPHFGPEVWTYFSVFLALQLFLNWRGAIPMLRLLRVIKPASESLQQMVARVSARMNCKVNKVWLWDSSTVNAMAFPLTGQLLFSRRLLEKLTIEEQEAVCAHELGHLTESHLVAMTRLIGVLGNSLLVLIVPTLNDFRIIGALVLFWSWIGFNKLGKWIGRKMEVRADGAATVDKGGEIYARALEKIYELNHAPAVMRGNGMVHPHLYDRIIASGITPSYPRPKPPEILSVPTLCLLFLVVAMFVLNTLSSS